MLVDSGAAETMVPTYALELVGIRNPTGRKVTLAGVGGTTSGADVFDGVEIAFGLRRSRESAGVCSPEVGG